MPTDHSPVDLAPCPFCGLSPGPLLTACGAADQHAIVCNRCGARGPVATGEAAAVAAWNQRIPLDGVKAEPMAMFMRDHKGNWIAPADPSNHDARERLRSLKSGDLLYVAPAVQAAPSVPVAEVFTTQALVPGGVEKCHVSLFKALPAGTKLYAAVPPSVPEGMVLVPKKPSCDMLKALSGHWHPSHWGQYKERYAAMIAAAPPAGVAQPVVSDEGEVQ